jgi:hypothetical protein
MMPLPRDCERPILDQFLRAEGMAMRAVRAARHDAPDHAIAFLRHHEEEEREHLKLFEGLTGRRAVDREDLPRLPGSWAAVAVNLFGYESLGFEFARLLAEIRPDLSHVLADEEGHVRFFETELRRILDAGGADAEGARAYVAGWLRRLPRTVKRYLRAEELAPWRSDIEARILDGVLARFRAIGLVSAA